MQKKKSLPKNRLIWMYTQMVRIREFEERVKRTFVEHPGVGIDADAPHALP